MISHKNIVVTGASSGIGKSIMDELAGQEGNRILAACRRAEAITGYGDNVIPFSCDLSTREGVDALFQKAEELFEILERHKGWRIKLAGAEEQKGKRKSFEKKKVFNIVFRDDQGDWLIMLITTDERSPEEIESLIDYYDEVNSRNSEEYSPLDIMVDIVDANPGWYWCDFNFDIDRKR